MYRVNPNLTRNPTSIYNDIYSITDLRAAGNPLIYVNQVCNIEGLSFGLARATTYVYILLMYIILYVYI